jgi:hypothetical protein
LSGINEIIEECVQRREKSGFQKNQKNQKNRNKQMMSAVIIYQKSEDYMLKRGLVGGGVLHVALREE